MNELPNLNDTNTYEAVPYRTPYTMSPAECGLLVLAGAMAFVTLLLICAARSVNDHFRRRMCSLGVVVLPVRGKKTCLITSPVALPVGFAPASCVNMPGSNKEDERTVEWNHAFGVLAPTSKPAW